VRFVATILEPTRAMHKLIAVNFSGLLWAQGFGWGRAIRKEIAVDLFVLLWVQGLG
jgi:hypothetical protein